MSTNPDTLTVYGVASTAGVSWNGKAAHDFIEHIITAVSDELARPTADIWDEFAHQTADACVPVWNSEVAEAWVGLQGWAYDDEVAELGGAAGSLEMLRVGLYVIALLLIDACRTLADEALGATASR
jgi:hypothetical protein